MLLALIDSLLKPLSILVGFVYPAYATFKAVESQVPDIQAAWLIYWVVISSLTVLEYILYYVLQVIPLYYALKIVFVLWLQYPSSPGSRLLYRKLILPVLKKHEAEIDRLTLGVVARASQLGVGGIGGYIPNASGASLGGAMDGSGPQVLLRRREEAGPDDASRNV